MKLRQLILACATSAILLMLSGSAAQAQDCFYGDSGFGFGGGYWNQPIFGSASSLYGSNMLPVPPYFSIHPPVYYSHEIVRRPMGASPFAYPSWYAPHAHHAAAVSAAPAPQPLLVENPYVKAKAE